MLSIASFCIIMNWSGEGPIGCVQYFLVIKSRILFSQPVITET